MKAFLQIIFGAVGFTLLLAEGDTFAASLAIKGAAVLCLIIAFALEGKVAKVNGRA